MKTNGPIARTVALALALAFLFGTMPASYSDADPSGVMVLLDHGNGKVEWTESIGSGTIGDVIYASLDAIGVEAVFTPSISIDGLSDGVIGAPGSGSYTSEGATGATVSVGWKVWSWDDAGDAWVSASPADPFTSTDLAISYGGPGHIPVVTPDHPNAHVMMCSDSSLSSAQTSGGRTVETEAVFTWKDRGSCYASTTYVQNYLFVKYGLSGGMGPSETNTARVVCYDYENGFDEVWTFAYPGIENYETGTPLISGNNIFVPSADGYVFRFDWRAGPGVDNANVIMTDATAGSSRPYSESEIESGVYRMPSDTGVELVGMRYHTGCTSLIGDSGVIYFNASNGMTYCIDEDLNLIWSHQSMGSIYYTVPSIRDGYLFVGSLDGSVHVLDKATGALIYEEVVFQKEYNGRMYGSVSNIASFYHQGLYYLIMPVSDGRGMSTLTSGYAVYRFNGATLDKVVLNMDVLGLVGSTFTPYEAGDLGCVFIAASKGIFKVDITGDYGLLCEDIKSVKAPISIVDGERMLLASYASGKPLYEVDLSGRILSQLPANYEVFNYCMSPPLVIGDTVIAGNDSGVYAAYGAFHPYTQPGASSDNSLEAVLTASAIAIGLMAAVYSYMRFVKGHRHPFGYMADSFQSYLGGGGVSHNTRSRRRLLVMMIAGIVLSIAMFVACICIGPTKILSPGEALSSLTSSISKGGRGLTYDEIVVYSSRLPRTIVAFAVGIGLSIAGVMYQAIIRNPLVDPYIMGVSSGAGTAAIAVIGFNFTFFGLFQPNSIFLTATVAMIGGVLAFAATMILAEKAGGTSINYVLAGVVIGLVFSAAQSIMLTTVSEHVTSSLSWLFGSFANVSWTHVPVVFFPVLGISLASLFWAKEFNLVLLGEDQAKQMGLNVRRFNRWMLIMASVLTSVCVAFCGIIGFVGLVVPHLCRMILGGDHRLVMPCSMAFGGFLLMFADLMSRMLWIGVELPVGAITTLIGIPVFAWLLIKRGKMYDG